MKKPTNVKSTPDRVDHAANIFGFLVQFKHDDFK